MFFSFGVVSGPQPARTPLRGGRRCWCWCWAAVTRSAPCRSCRYIFPSHHCRAWAGDLNELSGAFFSQGGGGGEDIATQNPNNLAGSGWRKRRVVPLLCARPCSRLDVRVTLKAARGVCVWAGPDRTRTQCTELSGTEKRLIQSSSADSSSHSRVCDEPAVGIDLGPYTSRLALFKKKKKKCLILFRFRD